MIQLPKPQRFTSTLTSIEKVTPWVYFERFTLAEPKEITFIAGQTVMLYVAPGINRNMSIASVPDEKHSILLVHDVGPMGPYSKWAISAKPGDPMSFMGPLGAFVVDKESPRKKVFVATGSGIAPFHSMIMSTPAGTMSLYWGVRREEDIFWQKDFENLAATNRNFRFTLILSAPTDAWQGKRGHVQEHVFTGEQDLTGTDFYLCGNKRMVTDMRDRLTAAGVPAGQIKFELFF